MQPSGINPVRNAMETPASTTLALPPEKLAEYRRGALAREARRPLEATERRFERAWAFARSAARLLKKQYGATRVVAFGSLLFPEDFGPLSDIDLAVEGVAWPAYFRAWAAVEQLTREFQVDLIDLATVSARFRERVMAEGESL